jgi:hypothetical protein
MLTKGENTKDCMFWCPDKMFDKIRNKHFASIFSVLGVTAKQLSAAQVEKVPLLSAWRALSAYHFSPDVLLGGKHYVVQILVISTCE